MRQSSNFPILGRGVPCHRNTIRIFYVGQSLIVKRTAFIATEYVMPGRH